jgi:Na+-translocating ferredoxin:NAD+ oxidoreductase RnfC subunit
MTAPNKIIFHARRRGQNLPRELTLMKQNSRARALALSPCCWSGTCESVCAAAENLRNELIRTLRIIIAHQLFTRSQSSNSIIRAEQTRVWPEKLVPAAEERSGVPATAECRCPKAAAAVGADVVYMYIYSQHSPEFLLAASKSNGPLFSLCLLRARGMSQSACNQ